MTVLVVASKKDPAGLNIASCLAREYGFDRSSDYPDPRISQKGDVLLALVEEDSIYADSVDTLTKASAVIFASKHKSDKGEPCLTVHCTGNVLNEAPYGGRPKSLALAEPRRVSSALLSLSESRGELGLPYLVSLEATHHGPSELRVPCMFVEIGSSTKQWDDPAAAQAVAHAIWAAATHPSTSTPAVGFGGGHYSWKHTETITKGEFALGHVLSKYFFQDYDPAIVELAFRKTVGDCSHAILDRKGMRGAERSKLVEFLEKSGRDVVMI